MGLLNLTVLLKTFFPFLFNLVKSRQMTYRECLCCVCVCVSVGGGGGGLEGGMEEAKVTWQKN